MSTIDKEKDDLATQQMVEMMQDTDENSTEQSNDFDVDALLNEIDDIESVAEPESVQLIDTDEEKIDSHTLEDIPTSDDELNDAMQDMAAALDSSSEEQALADNEQLLNDIPADQLTDDFVDELVMNDAEPSEMPAEVDITELNDDEPAESDLDMVDDLQSVDELLIDETPEEEDPTEIEEVSVTDSISEQLTEADEPAIDLDSEPEINIDFDPELAQKMLSASQENAENLEIEEANTQEIKPSELDSDDINDESMSENSDSKESGDLDMLDELDDLVDSATQREVSNTVTATEAQPEQDTPEEELDTDPNMTPEKRQLLQLVDETNQSVDAMSTSIELEEQSHEIIEQLSTTAKMTTKVALSTAEKAQHATENAQQAIEKTFAAIERARQITQQAKYQIDMQTLKSYDDKQLDAVLSQLQQRNLELQQTNNELAERVAKLYQS
ncbi:conserved hypothetical protein [uncultured Thiomicrorhabdus sp.]